MKQVKALLRLRVPRKKTTITGDPIVGTTQRDLPRKNSEGVGDGVTYTTHSTISTLGTG